MYDNIASLRFDTVTNGETVVGAMVSAEGEVMELRQAVPAEGRVEDWMTAVLLEMRRTNRLITKEAIYFYQHHKSRCVTYFSWCIFPGAVYINLLPVSGLLMTMMLWSA